MNILLINTFEKKGGAAVACRRLAVALSKKGVDASMLVRDKNTSDIFVSTIVHTPFQKIHSKFAFMGERLQIFLTNFFSRKNLFAVSTGSTGFNIVNHPLVKKADIIHLHWINQGFLSIRDIDQLIKLGKPIVWTMHDMWPVTGICHYAGQCTRYRKMCGRCVFLRLPYPADLSFRTLMQKKNVYGTKIHFVGCSQWITKKAETSMLGAGSHCLSIPNPIDTDFFAPGDRMEARRTLNLPADKQIILFGADIASEKRKGAEYLMQATRLLADMKEETELVFCGEVKENIFNTFGLRAHALGYLSDSQLILKMYQAADCFVIPSLEENLPNMVMEAMSCGVPCVGFNTGGIPEMIKHLENGYIAQYQSANDLAAGIRDVLDTKNKARYKQAARNFVLSHYAEPVVAEQYIRLYQNILNRPH